MSAAIDIDNASEPSRGDVVTLDPIEDPELHHARSVAMAKKHVLMPVAEWNRLYDLEAENKLLREAAMADNERIILLEAEKAHRVDADWDEQAGLIARGARAHVEPRLRAAFVEDASKSSPELAARLPELLGANR